MSQPQVQPKGRAYTISLARDVVSVAVVGLLLLFIHELGQPFERGFYCDDDTIRYPLKESTVSSGLCYAMGSGVNLFLILVIEYLSLKKELEVSESNSQNNAFPTELYVRRVYYKVIVWLFGAVSSELFTDIAKITSGRLRPHFIDVCKPVVHHSSPKTLQEFCESPESRHLYITNYTCTGIEKKIRDTRMSFMSGHSSYSAYSAAFAVLYIQSDLDITKFGLFKHAIQVLLASAAFYTGLSRVSDYKHHWQDVLTGLLQGTTVATLVSLALRPRYLESVSKYTRRNGRVSNGSETELGQVAY